MNKRLINILLINTRFYNNRLFFYYKRIYDSLIVVYNS